MYSLPTGEQNDLPTRESEKPCLVLCGLDELRPHPSYDRLGFTTPACMLSRLAEQGEVAFREPIFITRDRIVLDGYARWELARLKGRLRLPCIEYNLTEEESLRCLLQKHCRSSGLNDFCRILLALELEPFLKGQALSNQRTGGRLKGSSNLTEDATLDVRKAVAEAASVSVGNVTKVKQIKESVHSEVWAALRCGEVSIHRGWGWRTESEGRQREALRSYRSKKGINKTIRSLISRHAPKSDLYASDLETLLRQLSRLNPAELKSITVLEVRSPGKAIFISEELIRSWGPQEQIPL
jgi:hypothetical protein